MKQLKKSKASLMVSALAIFVLISFMLLMMYTYSNNNLKQAKRQEENMHAYFLAYSGCELAYAALLDEFAEYVKHNIGKKWSDFSMQFVETAFQNKHKICISLDGTVVEPGYTSSDFSVGSLSSGVFKNFKDSAILISVTRVSGFSIPEEEKPYKNCIRIESIAKTGISSSFSGYSKKYLYIDSESEGKIYWR